MESTSYWGSRTPAHIIFTLDLSCSMCGAKAEIVSKNVQNALVEIVRGSLRRDEVKDLAFITVIGYGQKESPVTIIRQGWVSEWADDVLCAMKNGTCIIPATAERSTPVDECFMMVFNQIEEWIQCLSSISEKGLGPIIVVNITDGEIDDASKTFEIATKIMELQNTWLFNIIILEDSEVDIFLPNNKYCLNGTGVDTLCRFFYDISSTIPDESVHLARCIGFDGVKNNSRGLLVSTTDKSAKIIIDIMCHN